MFPRAGSYFAALGVTMKCYTKEAGNTGCSQLSSLACCHSEPNLVCRNPKISQELN